MKERWTVKPLGAVSIFQGGGTPSKTVTDFWNGEIPWVSPKDMKFDSVGTSIDKITPDAIESSAASLIPTGSILIVVRSGILARTIPIAITTRELAVNQDIKAICPKSNLDENFLRYFLLSRETEILKLVTRGATVHRLATDDLKALGIPLPSLPEQQRIVAILDETFERIGAAVANAKKNRANARELFESYLNNIFTQKGEGWMETSLGDEIDLLTGFAFKSKEYTTSSDGITLLRGDNILQGYFRWEGAKKWPSNRVEEFGKYFLSEDDIVVAMDRTWIKAGLKYAKITKNELPCLLLQRVARLRNGNTINADFLFFLTGSRLFTEYVLSIQTGVGVPHISGKQIREFRFHKPGMAEQKEIVDNLRTLSIQIQNLQAAYQHKLDALAELKQSILQKAFCGELAQPTPEESSIASSSITADTTSAAFAANVIALAHYRHAANQRGKTFGRVKAQKTLHLVESIGDIDLGRKPMRDAAGPNDFQHMLKAEDWAKSEQFFKFVSRDNGYDFRKLARFDEMIVGARVMTKPYREVLDKIDDLILPKNSQEAEIFATVHAAWNNLIRDGADVDDEAIILAARDNWHPDKTKIPKDKFQKAIRFIRDKRIIPDGSAKRVGGQEKLL